MKKIVMKFALIAVLSVGMQLHAKAQEDPGDPGEDPDKVPLDPGAWVLVAAGVGYGINKWRIAKKQANKNYIKTTASYIEEK